MKTLEQLCADLAAAKSVEAEARYAREMIEAEIYTVVAAQTEIPEKGTVDVGPIKIVTTVAESWDQERLDQLAQVMPAEYFPFKAVWQCDTRAKNRLAIDHPNEYRKLFPALTVKPRKPSFRLVDERP